MKNLVILFVCLLFGSASFAAQPATKAKTKSTYDLKFDLAIKGQKLAPTTVAVTTGDKATVTQKVDGKTITIDVVVTETTAKVNPELRMDFQITTVADNGTQEAVSKPSIRTFVGEKASITQGVEGGEEVMSLEVIANKKAI